jgi:hypothetical protein
MVKKFKKHSLYSHFSLRKMRKFSFCESKCEKQYRTARNEKFKAVRNDKQDRQEEKGVGEVAVLRRIKKNVCR